MQKYLLMLFIAVGLVACQDELQPTPVNNPSESVTKSDYSISAEEALASLDEFLTEGEGPVSRSADRRVVKSIVPVSYRAVKSRAADQNLDCDNLVYIANFEQAKGYAILAADKRIPDKVIAVVDDGELAVSEVLTPYEPEDDDTRVYFEGYPMTGPGFFTMEETGDELFMNPNTVSLYVKEEGDTLVGNFEPEVGTITQSQGNTVKKFTSSLCINYAVDEIGRFDRSLYQPQEVNGNTKGDAESDINMNPKDFRYEKSATPWKIVDKSPNLLSAFAQWSQHSPFNNFYPYRRSAILFGSKDTVPSPAGCFPLAIAKLMTYFEYPDIYTYNGITVDWKELKRNYNSDRGKLSSAALLYSISQEAKCWYFKQGTFTFPSRATKAMKSFGIKNSKSVYYRFNRVVDMINEDKPVIIYGMPGFNLFKSHCWNIDGYKIKERTVTTKTYRCDLLYSTKTETERFEMVHCDFGWKSRGNGYYVSGVFDLKDREGNNRELDGADIANNNSRYNKFIRIVSYTKPRL